MEMKTASGLAMDISSSSSRIRKNTAAGLSRSSFP